MESTRYRQFKPAPKADEGCAVLMAATSNIGGQMQFTRARYAAHFAHVAELLEALDGAALSACTKAVAAALAQFELMCELFNFQQGDAFRLWRPTFDLTPSEAADFIALCTQAPKHSGAEYKMRRDRYGLVAGMYMSGIGSLIVRQWRGIGIGFDYFVERDEFFRDNDHEDSSLVNAPCATLRSRGAMETVGRESDAVATAQVPTSSFHGSRTVNIS